MVIYCWKLVLDKSEEEKCLWSLRKFFVEGVGGKMNVEKKGFSYIILKIK